MGNLISIIVPVYDVEDYIEKCLQSLLKQTYQNIEIILIDDGSNDNSGNICDEYQKREDRIRVFHQQNKGVSAARNTGMSMALGAYIVFVDSDDWVMPSYVETLYNLLMDNGADLAMIGMLHQYGNYSGEILHKGGSSHKELMIMSSEQTLANILDDMKFLGYVCNKIFKKEIISENHLVFCEEVNIWEDMLFCCQYILLIRKSVYCNMKLYVYNIRFNSVTNSNNYIKENTKLLAAEKMLELCEKKSQAFIKHMQIIYAATAIRVVSCYLYANGIYEPEIIIDKISRAKPYIFTKGVPNKLKLFYLGLKYLPKVSFRFYRIRKRIKYRCRAVKYGLRKRDI